MFIYEIYEIYEVKCHQKTIAAVQCSLAMSYEEISWATTFFFLSMTKLGFTILQRGFKTNFIQTLSFIKIGLVEQGLEASKFLHECEPLYGQS